MRRLLQLAALLLGCAIGLPTFAAPAFHSSATANSGSSAVSSQALTFSPTSGNTGVLSISLIGGTTVIVSTVTDNGAGGGSKWYPREGKTNASGSQEREEVWATPPGGIAASVTTITVTLQLVGGGSATSKIVLNGADYSGVNAMGLASIFTGSSTTPNHSASLSDANDIIVMGAAAGGTGTFSANTGSLRNSGHSTGTSSVGGALNDNTSPSAGNLVNQVTLSGSTSWTTVVLELKGTSSLTAGGNLVQGTLADIGGSDATSNAATTAVLAAPVTAGNTLVLALRTNTLGVTWTFGTVGTGTGTWTQATNIDGAVQGVQFYYLVNASATAYGVRLTPSSSNGWTMYMAEYNGLTSSPFDKTQKATGTSTSPDSGATATTTQANELLVSFIASESGGTATAGSGYTNRVSDANYTNHMLEDQVVSSTGAYHGTGTISPSAVWEACIATFKLSASAAINHLPLLGVTP